MKKLQIYGNIVGSCVGMSLLAGFILSIFVGMDRGMALLNTIGIYSMVAGGMILLIAPYSMYQSYVPLMLSVNCRRKELFLTFQGMKVLNIVGITLGTAVLLGIQSTFGEAELLGTDIRMFLGIGFCFLLIMSSMGNLTGILYQRFGKFSVILFMVSCALSGGVIGIASASGIKGGAPRIIANLTGGKLIIAGVVVAVLTSLLDGTVSWMILRKTEVRC